MSDPLIRELDHYVVLEAGRGERILSAAETLEWLCGVLAALPEPPEDLRHCPDERSRALRLLETACELALPGGASVQWFAVRLEPPSPGA
ncbi:chlororespiratory reduction protein 7 [Synechococcus sp. RSCCF101]|uniref:chlororespiratory reduction protein 7 n=1 Tax=Synechococcus sp. RSCCF101 TaxID=2511069 RepID=UPI001248C451|nr:chlororespiratory reduction protein 7 [Synechococcus sp. RSCCF101]QEY32921.1 chlororespiratory reduction protein 7 [Synechococcus sp. RSCCF101]